MARERCMIALHTHIILATLNEEYTVDRGGNRPEQTQSAKTMAIPITPASSLAN